MVDHALVGIDSAEDGSVVDAYLHRGLRDVFGDKEDESDFVYTSLADEDCARVVVQFGKL